MEAVLEDLDHCLDVVARLEVLTLGRDDARGLVAELRALLGRIGDEARHWQAVLALEGKGGD